MKPSSPWRFDQIHAKGKAPAAYREQLRREVLTEKQRARMAAGRIETEPSEIARVDPDAAQARLIRHAVEDLTHARQIDPKTEDWYGL